MRPDRVLADEVTIGRRVFAGLALAGFLGTAHQAKAQQMGKVSRIGVLLPWSGPTPEDTQYIEGDRPRYRALGWVEGQNLLVERRWVGTDPDRMREVAAELKALQVELIVTTGTTAIRAARDGAPGVPIVMVAAGDPVGAGFVRSLAHPGGDLTGTSGVGAEVLGKQLDPLFMPHYARIAAQAMRTNLPTALADPAFTRAGGLLSFNSDPFWHWHKAANYIDRILRGAKPAELAVEQPTHFERAINLKTARALGLVIPPAVLLQAAERIE